MEGSRGLFYYNGQYRPGHIEIAVNLGCKARCPSRDLCRSLGRCMLDYIIDQGNGPEPGSEGGGVLRVPNRNWCLEQMGVIVGNGDGFFHLLLPDNRGIAHQLLIVLMEGLRWRVRSDVLADRY